VWARLSLVRAKLAKPLATASQAMESPVQARESLSKALATASQAREPSCQTDNGCFFNAEMA